VGPTHDDLTMPAVAAAFGMRLERRQELVEMIRAAMAAEMHERDLRMAEIPEGARLVYGSERARWPVVAVENVYVLPGVPVIFRRKFAAVRELFRAGPIHGRIVFSREGEGAIAAALDEVVAAFPAVVVGSYPQVDAVDHKVKITVDGRDRALVDAATARLVEGLGLAFVRQEQAPEPESG
jgi:molybdopterin-biosynthesis enzyme MoeA-like protein